MDVSFAKSTISLQYTAYTKEKEISVCIAKCSVIVLLYHLL